MMRFEDLLKRVPQAPDWRVDWAKIWPIWPEFAALDSCPQDPTHHAEGDAGIHTRMVVEALVASEAWRALPEAERSLLFWTACLHDVAKPLTTREEEGRLRAPGHSRLGASMARGLLRTAGAAFFWRERLCALILRHQTPFWLIERPDPERLAIEIALDCPADLLMLQAEADARGRICADQARMLENVALAREIFAEAGCLTGPFPFANAESRLVWLERPERDPHYAAHEAFRCEVTVMSGLPGSGKDSWIRAHAPDSPVVSLDAIREEAGIDPGGDQSQVVAQAYAEAKAHLRARRDFVWNATNVTRQTRAKLFRVLRDYGARIRIVYLEPPPEKLEAQNREREAAVPAKVMAGLARKLEPPSLTEAHEVIRIV